MDPDRSALELILGRRSHRVGFESRTVPDDVLTEIVRAGLAAPSSKGAQPWRIHVVTDRSLIEDIADGVATAPEAPRYVPVDPRSGLPRDNWESTVIESAGVLSGAPAALFIENLGHFSGGRSCLAQRPPEALRGALVAYMLECVGLGAAVQNLWLAAEALGLKACFMGDIGVDDRRIERLLSMDGELVGALAVGYSDLKPEVKRSADDADIVRVRWHR